MTRERCSIGDFVEAGTADIQTGPFGTQLKASQYCNEGTPVINVRNIGYGSLKPEKLEFVNEDTSNRLSVHLIKQDDIVFGRKGAVDRHLFVKKDQENWLQGSDCIRLRFLSEKIHPRYISYIFLTESHKKWMLMQSGNKATMASLNHDIIKRIPIILPPFDLQKKIVAVLSAYDDLIENNTRRIQLLEDSARHLYEEWFVRLRFPGYEHTPKENGVPKGWTHLAIEKIAECVGGGTPSTKNPEYWDGGTITWVTPTDVTRNKQYILLDSEKKITDDGLKKSSAKMVPSHSILMTSRASVGYFALPCREVCTNQGFISIVPEEPHQTFYLLYHLVSRVDDIRQMGSGSTYPEVSRGKFRNFEILLPKDNLIRDFQDYCYNTFKQIRNLKIQNEKLKEARDLLLPRFISGDIPV